MKRYREVGQKGPEFNTGASLSIGAATISQRRFGELKRTFRIVTSMPQVGERHQRSDNAQHEG